VCIERGRDYECLSLRRLYPCGEGAGYAGGIVSAAVDGLAIGQHIADELLRGVGQSDLERTEEP
jgi:hypothetical protein